MNIGKQLEQYTLKNPQEVLLVTIAVDGEEEEISIFKGFSSSLTRSTPYDPDIPIIPETATIIKIDRLASPYHPLNPRYIQENLSLEEMQFLLIN
ncbi:MAG: hypothetical protein LW635_13735 [Microcystis sp. 53598_E5]|jgi:hypothetical protein|uniref:DUF7734 domain-containing protein n=2 Tax=Microcystis aeruginosa TaxID=1126 RepID=A0A2Z6UQY0_MICAE|nr:hypothetical protein [Microcystis aeruginosa]MCE2674623.1 hypothetical protein [Microcystis sp. 53598_E5]NCR01231.1 hypothetical protein [Microcystis aeruginosa L211-11]NCR32218.1 hypothetical protein [Microcystis aeruginosa L211-101]TRU29813.1 MAG: hypothetical protein EWV80_03720 [Microcystis aeruginosa Ma_QC_B_20070730_S2]MDB9395078.1 hypothetical protein [Microcystis aeruginosa CS-573]